ncbi:MAG TPA: pyrrolo-quinoline quinone, partial [Erythrobacter sp.]|nr:pyrrolo-quinoline quinone [Erythrobacter sp.]
GGGMLFAVGSDGVVSAFDAATGAARWSYNPGVESALRDSAFGGGVSYADGKVYMTDGVGDVAALDAASGSVVWKVRPSGPLRGSPTVAFGSVFVMTQDDQIFALDAADGSVLWQDTGSSTQAGVFGVAAPAAAQGTVIAGYSSGELIAHRYENGRTLWADALALTSISTQVGSLTDIDADPIIDNGRVYALGQGGRMAAYELVTGQRIWELNLAGISTPAIAGEWIFTLTDDARLLAIARSTGKVRWLTQLPRWRDEKDKKGPIFWSGPVLAGNNLWAVSSEGEVYRISSAEGSASLFTDLDEPVSLAPIVANNTLYILDDSGRITAFR